MVLTEQELTLASMSQRDHRIRSALSTRRTTQNFSEQAACDREIQRYLLRKGSQAYKFNCCVVHQPWRFVKMAALPDHGWEEFGPTNETLYAIYCTLPMYTANLRQVEINNLNKGTDRKVKAPKNNNNVVIEYDSDDKPPSWGFRLLSCIFA